MSLEQHVTAEAIVWKHRSEWLPELHRWIHSGFKMWVHFLLFFLYNCFGFLFFCASGKKVPKHRGNSVEPSDLRLLSNGYGVSQISPYEGTGMLELSMPDPLEISRRQESGSGLCPPPLWKHMHARPIRAYMCMGVLEGITNHVWAPLVHIGLCPVL